MADQTAAAAKEWFRRTVTARRMKKIVIAADSVYLSVLAAYLLGQFILEQYGLEYRACLEEFRVFWTCKLSFVLGALVLFYSYLCEMELKQREEDFNPRHFRILWIFIPIAYLTVTLFLLFCLALSGCMDTSQEELLDNGCLKVTVAPGLRRAEYYYCEPISDYVREPLTSPSRETDPQYES